MKNLFKSKATVFGLVTFGIVFNVVFMGWYVAQSDALFAGIFGVLLGMNLLNAIEITRS